MAFAAIGRSRGVEGKFVRRPEQCHAITPGGALLRLYWSVEQDNGLALGIVPSDDPACRSQFHDPNPFRWRLPDVLLLVRMDARQAFSSGLGAPPYNSCGH